MISETVLLWLGTIALLVNYAGLARAENKASEGIAYAFAFVLWLTFTMNALSYQVFSGGSALAAGSQSLWVLGILGTIATLVLLVATAFDGIAEAFQEALK